MKEVKQNKNFHLDKRTPTYKYGFGTEFLQYN